MALRVLTWNLMHGRSVPPAGRELLEEFSAALAGWEWDVALLQEVPPWWPPALTRRLGAEHRLVLTSRNALPRIRRAVATRWPDLIGSNGGGCNVIFVRGRSIAAHRTRRLSLLPERRWLHAVQLEDGLWVGNLHTAADARQSRAAAEALHAWAGEAPMVLGGDFNVSMPQLEGFAHAGGNGTDRVFVSGGLAASGAPEVLDRGNLSDHAPVLVSVRSATPGDRVRSATPGQP